MEHLSKRFKTQLKELIAVAEKDGVLSAVKGFRQTVEDPTTLELDPDNANLHTPENLSAIGESLNRFGFRKTPIAVQEQTRRVFAGNGIVTYLRENNVPVCPVLWIPADIDDTEIKAFALADNQTARLSEWDEHQLHATLTDIAETLADKATAERLTGGLGFDAGFLSEIEQRETELLARIETAEKNTPAPITPAPLLKLLFVPSDIAIVEKAIAETGHETRGTAIAEICKDYLKRKKNAKNA